VTHVDLVCSFLSNTLLSTAALLTPVFHWFLFYREKLRHEKILSSLAGNITTSHTIYPPFGTAEFFEFVLRNPYSTEQTITIHCDDNELKYVFSPPWRRRREEGVFPLSRLIRMCWMQLYDWIYYDGGAFLIVLLE